MADLKEALGRIVFGILVIFADNIHLNDDRLAAAFKNIGLGPLIPDSFYEGVRKAVAFGLALKQCIFTVSPVYGFEEEWVELNMNRHIYGVLGDIYPDRYLKRFLVGYGKSLIGRIWLKLIKHSKDYNALNRH